MDKKSNEKLLYIITRCNGLYGIRASNYSFLEFLFKKYHLNYYEYIKYCEENYVINFSYNDPHFYLEQDAINVIEYIENLIIMEKLAG